MLKAVKNLKKFILHIFSLDTREITAGQCTMSGQILACSSGVLLGRVNVKKLAIVYSTGHVLFGVRVCGGGRVRGKAKKDAIHSPSPTPLLIFYFRLLPFGTNFFLSPAFRCCGHSFRLENTKHSLAKITPALQASQI